MVVVLASAACRSQDARAAQPGVLAPAHFADRVALHSPAPGAPDEPPVEADGAPREGAEADAFAIDLAMALEMGGANSLQVELARAMLAESNALLDTAEARWLPDLWLGVSYEKHEGALQETTGNVLDVSRNAGFIGAGLFASFNFVDALLEPRSALLDVDAAGADVAASVNDTLLGIALAYNDLLEAQSLRGLALENVALARDLVELAEAFSRSGQGLESDAARARNELAGRRRILAAAEESIALRSTVLAKRLRLDPTLALRADEPALVPFVLVPGELELDRLIAQAMESRPDLRSLESTVQAQEEREAQERLRPFVPRLNVGVRGGGLGGGTGSNFDDFDEEGELTASLVWTVRNLGAGESAARRRKAAQHRQAIIRLQLARDSVAEEVSLAHVQIREGRRQMEFAARTVAESLESLELNMRRIRGAEGLPIEALQAIDASAKAKDTYLATVAEFNRSQFRLLRAVGSAPRP